MVKHLCITAFAILLASCQRAAIDLNPSGVDKSGAYCDSGSNNIKQEPKSPSEDLNTAEKFVTPTEKLKESEWPDLIDDLQFEGMELAISRQLQRFQEIDLTKKIKLGPDTYRLTWAKKSLIKFRALIKEHNDCEKTNLTTCRSDFNLKMKKNFNAYIPKLEKTDPRFGEPAPVLFTAYYTPALAASMEKNDEFKYAVYKKPWENQKTSFSRVEIDFRKALAGDRLEMFYTNNLFNLYLMHVQGGGHINLINKGKVTSKYVSYDGTNGKSWNFISKYMREKNMISDGSIQSQREYLESNPERQEEIYESCPSYVYFKNSFEPPEGSDRVPLTDNRSIATDSNLYMFKGLLAFVSAHRPKENQDKNLRCEMVSFRPYSRFYLDQDTGGAIRGKGRVDLYFGEGEYAELAAYNLVSRGDLYFFMLK